jgi:hypothetical protein
LFEEVAEIQGFWIRGGIQKRADAEDFLQRLQRRAVVVVFLY